MIKILKTDNTYRRDQEFIDISFWDCAKIKTQNTPWEWKENMLTRYCLILVSDGSVRFKINKKETVILESNMLLMLAPNTLISAYEQSSASTIWIVTFQCDDFIFFDFPHNYLAINASSTIHPMFNQLNSYVVHHSKPHFYYDSLLMMILDEISKQIITDEKKRQIYDEICEYISRHVNEDMTVQKISDVMNYNKDYLGRIIRECNGSNIKQLIIDEKLKLSKNLLQMTNYSCEKIGALIGINSANKFIKFFKYHTGETPSEYRAAYQFI